MAQVDKKRFIQLLLDCGVMKFGQFVTKSGRTTPYFMNFGEVDSGTTLRSLAEYYGQTILNEFPDCTNLYGPAYKGIPLAVMISDQLATMRNTDITFTFNRKEAKDHGEGGNLVGHSYSGDEKVVIVEDVITGGTSLRESIPILKDLGVNVVGALVGVDRLERGAGSLAASAEIEEQYGVPVRSIVNIREIVDILHGMTVDGKVLIDDTMRQSIHEYQNQYGVGL